MRKLLLLLLLLPQLALAVDYEANVKALSPTAWWKGYYGNTVQATNTNTIRVIKDFSGNSRDFSQTTNAAFQAYPTRGDSRGNLAIYSERLDSAVWDHNVAGTLTEADITANPISGAITADRIYDNPGNANSNWILQTVTSWIPVGTTVVSGIYVKKTATGPNSISYGCWDDVAGFISSSCDLSDGAWHLCSKTCAFAGGSTVRKIGWADVALVNDGVYAWGAHVYPPSLSDTTYVSVHESQIAYPGVSGLPALHFDGVNDYYTSTATLGNLFANNNKHLFLGFRTGTITAAAQNVFNYSAASYVRVYIVNDTVYFENYDTNADKVGLTILPNTVYILEAYHNSGEISIRLNGGAWAAPVASGNTGTLVGTITLSNGTAGNAFLGDLTELITFNTKLSDANAQTVYDYLSWTLNDPWKRVEVLP